VRGVPGGGRIRSGGVSEEARVSDNNHTLPFNVVAANSLAAASAGGDSRIASVVVHASCYDAVLAQSAFFMPLPHTDFWNCSKYWCACSFWVRFPADCIMLCAASTGSKPCCAPFAAILGRAGRWWGRKTRRAPGERMAGYHLCGVHVLKALSVSDVRLGKACNSGQVRLRAACEVCLVRAEKPRRSHSQSRGPAHLPAKASLKCSPSESTTASHPPHLHPRRLPAATASRTAFRARPTAYLPPITYSKMTGRGGTCIASHCLRQLLTSPRPWRRKRYGTTTRVHRVATILTTAQSSSRPSTSSSSYCNRERLSQYGSTRTWACALRESSGYDNWRCSAANMSLTRRQGFDEFMNLVIDEAVEVTLANPKKETPEERRQIG
jgi:hypothetical protein